MKKIVFFGDSITDMGRARELDASQPYLFGNGYVFLLYSALAKKYPKKFELLNKGISGNKTVDLYARIKRDVWNEAPDYLSIFVGSNDLGQGISRNDGLDLETFEKIYRMIIDDTLKRLPNVKIMLVEPFILNGTKTGEKIDEWRKISNYAKVVSKLAIEYGFPLVEIQSDFDRLAKTYGDEYYSYDGQHPTIAGATIIADNWLKVFEKNFEI